VGYADYLLDLDYSPTDAAVCRAHIIDDYLRDAVAEQVQEYECFACGRTGVSGQGDPFAIPLDELTERVLSAVKRHFARAVDGVPWDSEEGGYALATYDTSQAVTDVCEFAFDADHDGQILERILDSVDDEAWVPENRAVESAEYLWDEFSRTVMHESRFMILDDDHDDDTAFDTFPPDWSSWRHRPSQAIASLLTAVADTITEMDLLVTESEGTSYYRGRLIDSPRLGKPSAEWLGPPPQEHAATPNRMSPPGIVMFYVSGDAQTAVKEIAGHGPKPYARVGAFRSTRELRMIDLTCEPVPLHYFDEPGFGRYQNSQFLHYFVKEITRPIIPDGREHREYVPTQVVTEYLRWGLKERVDGIKLPSAQSARATYVLFFGARDVADAGSQRPVGRAPVFTLAPEDVQVYEVQRSYDGIPVKERLWAKESR
jgi:hypothetical protein